jgi:RNA polymerase sigma-70 factor (ECF subfamily)
MAASIQEAKLTGFPARVSKPEARVRAHPEAFEENRHRVYSLAFWMTDNELVAEELTVNTFCRAFALSPDPDAESVDRALAAELRELMPLGSLTLRCAPCSQVLGVRRNAKRVELERAVVQLPATERMVFLLHDVERYDHARISRILGLSEQESACGLHQARLRLRELLVALA